MDLENKVQNSSLLRGIVSETRPGGDVIIDTPKGQIRAQSDASIEEGSEVSVKITMLQNGEKRAIIVADQPSNSPYADPHNIKPSVVNYIKNIFFGENFASIKQNILTGRFSYMSPNVRILDFGHISPQTPIKLEIVTPESAHGRQSIINGSIISNDSGKILVNTEIGILNIEAKSTIEPGQKLLICILGAPQEEQTTQIKGVVDSLLANITQNLALLKKIIEANKNIASKTGYKTLLKLFLSPHDTAILAKIFRQTGEVPASEVSQWIENDIVKPFKSAAKNYRLGLLTHQMEEARTLLEEAKLLPIAAWHEMPFIIPGTKEETTLKVKRDHENVQFKLETVHPDFGQILLSGMLSLNMTHNSISNFDMKVKYSQEFPEMLISNLQSIFNDHIATSNIRGHIEFGSI